MILLGPYAAQSCPVKVQHEHDRLAAPAPADDAAAQERFAGAQAFKDQIFPVLAQVPGAVDLRDQSSDAARAATVAAVEAGAKLIIAPKLPIDVHGHRWGSPEVLVRDCDRVDGGPGYLPVRIKKHLVLEKQKLGEPWLSIASLEQPHRADSVIPEQLTFRSSRSDDALQLAHLWRLLESLTWVSEGTPRAGVIGTDSIEDLNGEHTLAGNPGVVWLTLTHKVFRTFSRTAASGWKRRSALERYDHEFGFRLKVAATAAARTRPDDRLMVQPIVTRECGSCQWWTICAPALADDDLSRQIEKSPLDVREITSLRKLGIATVTDLVGADIEALLPEYLPEVQHRPHAEQRLRLAARRAQLISEGVALARSSQGPIDLPAYDLEIDFDIETSRDDRVYLWGFLVDDRASGERYYRAFTAFTDLDDASEASLATEAAEWLVALIRGRRAQIYHYSDFELIHVAKVARQTSAPALHQLLQHTEAFTDLFSVVRAHWFGARGLGLKVVAAQGPQFQWRDEDPSGLNSQTWFDDACGAETEELRQAAATRVLEYNEDDVRATHAVRAWLRQS